MTVHARPSARPPARPPARHPARSAARGSEAEPPSQSDVQVNVRSVALTVIAVAAGMYTLYWAQEVFIPIVLSVLISYALEPVVRGLMRIRFPRMLASALVVGALTSSAG